MNNKYLITMLLVILAGGLGFYGGIFYQKGKNIKGGFSGNPQGNFQVRNGGSGNQQRINQNGFRPLTGEIISKDDKSITIKANDGSGKIIIISSSTVFNKVAETNFTEVKVGDLVRVLGTVNSDGSVTAQDVQLNPEMRRVGGGSAPSDN